MTRHILTQQTADGIESSNHYEHEDKCISMMEQPGNPMGIVLEKIGSVTLVGSKVLGSSMNRAMGVGAKDTQQLDSIFRFFEAHGMDFRIDISPFDYDADLLAKLTDLGFAQSAFHTVLYGTPQMEQPVFPEGVTVRQVQDDEFDLYADLYVRSFGMPEWTKAGLAANNRLLNERPGRSFYIAVVEGVPAGMAGLFLHESMANLAVAGTVPEFRGRGVQQALLQQRMYVAGQGEHAYTMVGQAAVGSASMRNMQRAGLEIAYTKAFWTKKRPSQ